MQLHHCGDCSLRIGSKGLVITMRTAPGFFGFRQEKKPPITKWGRRAWIAILQPMQEIAQLSAKSKKRPRRWPIGTRREPQNPSIMSFMVIGSSPRGGVGGTVRAGRRKRR